MFILLKTMFLLWILGNICASEYLSEAQQQELLQKHHVTHDTHDTLVFCFEIHRILLHGTICDSY